MAVLAGAILIAVPALVLLYSSQYSFHFDKRQILLVTASVSWVSVLAVISWMHRLAQQSKGIGFQLILIFVLLMWPVFTIEGGLALRESVNAADRSQPNSIFIGVNYDSH